ncbi:MAG: c-type cytochrome [Ignavibacteria bacterium]|nr:c-type cytochrome [Ignavibacteria bacterium]
MNKSFLPKGKIMLLTLSLVLLSSSMAFAQTEEAPDLGKVFHIGIFIFFALVFFVLITLIAYHNSEDNEVPSLIKALSFLNSKLTNATPIENEEAVLLNHDYDGIKELDNVLPPWWKYLFYVTIVWGGVYLFNYHVINIWPLSDGEYQEEVKQAEAQKAILLGSGALVNEKTVTLLTDQAAIFSGGEIFKKNCAACHGFKGEGLVGPNLTDNYWIHGGGIKNVFRTVSNGVPDKGMLTWKTQLKPKEIQEVASYVISLQGTNPPNAKPPQGTLWAEAPADSTKKDSVKK